MALAGRRGLGRLSNARQGARVYRDRFLNYANALTEHPDLDDERFQRIAGYAALLERREAFWMLWNVLRRADQEIRSQDLFRFQNKIPAGVDVDWHLMFYNWMMAVSYDRPVLGVWMRARIAKILDPSYPPCAADVVIEDRLGSVARVWVAP